MAGRAFDTERELQLQIDAVGAVEVPLVPTGDKTVARQIDRVDDPRRVDDCELILHVMIDDPDLVVDRAWYRIGALDLPLARYDHASSRWWTCELLEGSVPFAAVAAYATAEALHLHKRAGVATIRYEAWTQSAEAAERVESLRLKTRHNYGLELMYKDGVVRAEMPEATRERIAEHMMH